MSHEGSQPPQGRLAWVDVGGFMLQEMVYRPHFRMPSHGHEPAIISSYLAGGCTERVGSKTVSPRTGWTVFHPADEEHEVQFDGTATRIFNVVVRPPLLRHAEQHGVRSRSRRQLTTAKLTWLTARLYHAFKRASPPKLAMEGLVYELLAEIGDLPLESKLTSGSTPSRAEALLREGFQRSIGLQEVASELGVHPAYLARAFRAAYGQTLGERLREIRVEHATQLLAGSSLDIAEIAIECGFSDHSHLSRTFRAHSGLSPAAYRKAYGPRSFAFQG